MPSASTTRILILALVAAASLGGCSGPLPAPPPLELDEVVTHVPLDWDARPEVEATTSRPVRLTLLALEAMPTDVLATLSSSATLVAQPDEAIPVRAVAGPSRGTRFGTLEAPDELLDPARAGRWGHHQALPDMAGVIAPGVATDFSLEAEPPIDFAVDGSLRRAGVTLEFRPDPDDAERLDFSMLIEARRPAPVTGALDAKPDRTEILQTERVNWQLTLDDEPTILGLVVPSPFPAAHGEALLAIIELLPPPESGTEHAAAWQRALATCREDLALAEDRPAPADPEAANITLALSALLSPGDHRGALVYLADETGTRFAGDIALAGGDEIIEEISADFIESWSGPGEVELKSALAAALARSTYRAVASRATDNELSSVVRGIVLMYAGEAGRHPALLRDILETSFSSEQMTERVLAANIDFLESSSPSSRVRAYDWLVGREIILEGYDPLADRAERRAALEAFQEARE